jgi:phosphonate dehydrogenase
MIIAIPDQRKLHRTVVVTNWVHDAVLNVLAAHFNVISNQTREPMAHDLLAAHLAGAHAMMAFMTDKVDEAMLAKAPHLAIIACALKGADNFDIGACARRNVAVTIVPDLLTVPTAELTIGLTIALARNILTGDRLVRQGAFSGWRPTLYGKGIAGSTIGIVGLGAVGRAVIAPLQALGAHVIGFDERVVDAKNPDIGGVSSGPGGITRVSFEDLLRRSDFVVLALPLTARTSQLINRETLAIMQRGAMLINPARGSIVDEEAVADALEDGHLGGYAADVFAFEDWVQPDRPREVPKRLRAHPATVFTPHLGSAVDSVRRDIAMSAADDIIAFMLGRRSPNAVNDVMPMVGRS